MEITLTEWLEGTQVRRTELEDYGRSLLPADIGERHADMDIAIKCADDAGRLLADAESFLSQAKAIAMYNALKDEDLGAKEREIVIKNEVRHVQRIVDGLKVTTKTLMNRLYSNMNSNRSRL